MALFVCMFVCMSAFLASLLFDTQGPANSYVHVAVVLARRRSGAFISHFV